MKKRIKAILGVFIFFFSIYYFFGGGLEDQALKEMNKIENYVAVDAEKQYRIAKKNGSEMDAYVSASLVVAAYLQANDEVNYKKWKVIENRHAKNIGLK